MRRAMAVLLPAFLMTFSMAAGAERGAEIVKASGVRAGLIVHLGVTDGKLTAGLSGGGKFLVHGLASDAAAVERARKHIRSRGLYGKVSVERGSFKKLPYADRLVNLIVAEDAAGMLAKGLSLAEVARVLAPGGVALLGGKVPAAKLSAAGMGKAETVDISGTWTKSVKPRPKAMDEWTHWRHDATGDCTSGDTLIGPPARLRWIDGPMRGRSHSDRPRAAVSAGGRNFYIVCEGTPYLGVPRRPVLICRDAYNGLVLWKRPVAVEFTKRETAVYIKWLKGEAKRFSLRDWTNYHALRLPLPQRAMVATPDRVYAVIESGGPLVAIDAATGKTLKTYDGPSPSEVLHHDGKLLLVAKRGARCLAAADGRQLWSLDEPVKDAVIADGQAFFMGLTKWPPEVLSVSLADGAKRWRASTAKLREWPAKPFKKFSLDLIMHAGGALIFAGAAKNRNGAIDAISAKNGAHLWSKRGASKGRIGPTAFRLGGLVWYSGKGQGYGNNWMGLDPTSGAVKKTVKTRKYRPRGQKCNLNTATSRYIIAGMMEFIDTIENKQVSTFAARGVCSFGVLPANGLTYVFPTDCVCFPMLRGNMGLAGPAAGAAPKAAHPLEKGPAYGSAGAKAAGSGDWPSYRRDAARGGSASTRVVAGVKQLWEKKLGTRLSPPTVAAGTVYVADVDSHRVYALDAATGKERWSRAAGARVSFPPTVYRGLCLFGSQDGWVYCLSASDGRLVWRYRAAPREKRISAYRQMESVWPVAGSVLVHEGTAYFAAGRTTQADGGVYMHALDAKTGKVLWQAQPKGNTIADMLIMDKGSLYMWRRKFDAKTGRGIKMKSGEKRSLVAGDTFLNDVWNFRTAWNYGKNRGNLLTIDGERVFGVRVLPYKRDQAGKYRWVIPGKGHYHLYGATKKGQNDLKPQWSVAVPLRMRAMVLAGDNVFVAGEEDAVYPKKAELRGFSAADGKELRKLALPAAPVLDGMAAAGGRLYLSTKDGVLRCFGKE